MDAKLIRKVRRHDRLATWVITGGGVFVIVTVIGMLFLIAKVALPLFLPPSVEPYAGFAAPPPIEGAEILAVGLDEYLETGFMLDATGNFTFFSIGNGGNGKVLDTPGLKPPGAPGAPVLRIVRAEPHGLLRFGLLWSDGSFHLVQVVFKPVFDMESRRTITHTVKTLARLDRPAGSALPLDVTGRLEEETGLTLAMLLPGNRIALYRRSEAENLLGGTEVEETRAEIAGSLPGRVTRILLNASGGVLYAGTSDGILLRWDVEDLEAVQRLDARPVSGERASITALALMLGEFTLAVGDEKGGLSGWFPARQEASGALRLTPVHRFRGHAGRVLGLLPSARAKTMVSLGSDGTVRFDQITTERTLAEIRPPSPLRLASLSGRANGLIGLDQEGRIRVWRVNLPHPEVSWGTFFSRLWYEGYPAPAFVWQSSAGTDDFEPKLSLVPLIFGTLKGTFYGMLFAAPLAILGALYTSSLMNAGLRRFIKPAFEIIGAVPTVVIGFLAALWLAPILKASLTAFLLMLGFLPLTIIASTVLFEQLRKMEWARKAVLGREFFWMIPMVLLAAWLAFLSGRALDATLFNGALADWMFSAAELRLDQRNSFVIAVALGFAVLPTVFTLSDDSLMNVPRNLTAASLALGASRWQTVWRVVLPSASPGIFAALMLGLGRAVGETMIVLMATGNTPIMDWSPLNGMRTLSANIAVEIPEAPEGGTLYRTLFLSAVILFLTTFLLNTLAEVVRERLRKKYGQY